MSAFANMQEPAAPQIANPFGTSNQSSSPWQGNNGFTNGFANASSGFSNGVSNMNNALNGMQTTQAQSGFINPFRDQVGKANGFQPVFPSSGLSSAWGANPFKVSFCLVIN